MTAMFERQVKQGSGDEVVNKDRRKTRHRYI